MMNLERVFYSMSEAILTLLPDVVIHKISRVIDIDLILPDLAIGPVFPEME